ncbi:UDP-N-acetylmuramate dehydrogenase [Blattabacterium cuenoti]|uniref:UDP-N-acetylmuramate dehydrogenase n=1 Tax=Blattabacterium cuenoti TaxID=1653831 RepID=UPI00163CFC5C|nr:UDP-N-acetylmuramate dehydrogenase [Blattabacterium cuenoti]
MLIKQNFSIKRLNTFGLNVFSRYYTEITNIEEIKNIFTRFNYIKKIFIGNGSNILFLKDYYPGLVIRVKIKGKKIIYEDDYKAIVKAFSGENWSNFVKWTIKKGFNGLENLSFIPGTVGASPIQNIGAYGSEIKDCLLKVQVYEISNGKIKDFTQKECKLQYRDSIFKNNMYKNKFFILSVFFILRKKKCNTLNTYYIEIQKELENMNIEKPTSYDISKAIFNIRKKKLPNPMEIGNAGSFFINPIVEKVFFNRLKFKYPTIMGNCISNNKIKIFASSLIETAGWKGKRIGNVGVYKKLPIILVNYGGASGMEIYLFSKSIIKNIKKRFGIFLFREVNVIR